MRYKLDEVVGWKMEKLFCIIFIKKIVDEFSKKIFFASNLTKKIFEFLNFRKYEID